MKFINVLVGTRANPEGSRVRINVNDIAALKPNEGTVSSQQDCQTIIERISQPNFALWSLETIADIEHRIMQVGGEIA